MKKCKHDVPHKSTTHEELFFHIENKGTVFFRKEDSPIDGAYWAGVAALCNPKDQFNRAIGRNVARRRYFQQYCEDAFEHFRSKPTYQDALMVYEFEREFCGLA